MFCCSSKHLFLKDKTLTNYFLAGGQVVMKNTSRLCHTKPIVTVNGQFPGPTLYAREGDNVLVKVVNHVKYNVSIHWSV